MISTHENYTPASGENRVYEDEMKPSGLVAVADSVGTKCPRGDRETSGGRPHIVLTSEYLRYVHLFSPYSVFTTGSVPAKVILAGPH